MSIGIYVDNDKCSTHDHVAVFILAGHVGDVYHNNSLNLKLGLTAVPVDHCSYTPAQAGQPELQFLGILAFFKSYRWKICFLVCGGGMGCG